MNIIIGLLCGAGGVGLILGAYWLEHSIFHFGLAEKYLGPGGGTLGYKLVGLLVIVFGVLVGFGLLDLGGSEELGAPADRPAQTSPASTPQAPGGGANFAQ